LNTTWPRSTIERGHVLFSVAHELLWDATRLLGVTRNELSMKIKRLGFEND
jgi:hypothetical protein